MRDHTLRPGLAIGSDGPAIDGLAAGAADTDRMVAYTLPLDQFDETVALIRRGEGLKLQVKPT